MPSSQNPKGKQINAAGSKLFQGKRPRYSDYFITFAAELNKTCAEE